jgi:hypothetical protein
MTRRVLLRGHRPASNSDLGPRAIYIANVELSLQTAGAADSGRYIQFIARDALDDDGKRSSFIPRHMIEQVITARAITRDNFAGEPDVAEC